MITLKHAARAATLAVLSTVALAAATAADLSGAGATFPYPIYAKWAEAYRAKTGIGLNYQSIGSGGGIKQIKAGTVTFGASDKPLEAKELNESGLTQFPMTARLVFLVVGPVVDLKLIALQAGTFGARFASRFAPVTFVVAVLTATAVGAVLL